MMFQKAERKKVWLKMAFTGPTHAGKTYSALKVASAMGGKVAFIDTENGSAKYYAEEFDFDTVEVDAPYTVQKFQEAIQAAVDAKYEVLIIDSISHVWAGDGGLLQQKEELDARGLAGDRKHSNQWTNWGSITKQQNAFMSWLLAADIHTIVTMRSKMEYVQGEDRKVKKLGMAPIQRDGVEYEFGIVFDMDLAHKATPSKDRTGIFKDSYFQPNEETGKKLLAWLGTGKGELERKPKPAAPVEMVTLDDRKHIQKVAEENRWTATDVQDHMAEFYKKAHTKDLTKTEYYGMITYIGDNPAKEKKTEVPA